MKRAGEPCFYRVLRGIKHFRLVFKGLGGGASRREFFPIFYKSFGEFYIVRMRGFSGAIPGGEIALYFGIFERFGRKPKIRFGNRQNI